MTRHVALGVALAVLLVGCSDPGSPRSQPSAPSTSSPDRVPAVVTRVVDGDTAHMRVEGRDVDVRFIGIDTPETVAPDHPIECYGPQASAYTEHHLEGRRVELEFDVEREDRYGRTLAYVWLGASDFERRAYRGFAAVTLRLIARRL